MTFNTFFCVSFKLFHEFLVNLRGPGRSMGLGPDANFSVAVYSRMEGVVESTGGVQYSIIVLRATCLYVCFSPWHFVWGWLATNLPG